MTRALSLVLISALTVVAAHAQTPASVEKEIMDAGDTASGVRVTRG